jgi:hypothetical protein
VLLFLDQRADGTLRVCISLGKFSTPIRPWGSAVRPLPEDDGRPAGGAAAAAAALGAGPRLEFKARIREGRQPGLTRPALLSTWPRAGRYPERHQEFRSPR